MRCQHKWRAPYLLAPTAPRVIQTGGVTIPVRGDTLRVEQRCHLQEGHAGPHRSLSNVTDSRK